MLCLQESKMESTVNMIYALYFFDLMMLLMYTFDFKTCYKATVNNTVWYWIRTDIQINGVEINSYT